MVPADARTREGPCPTCGQHIRVEDPGGERLDAPAPATRLGQTGLEHAESVPSSYEMIVKKLAEYEAAGLPVNHPDRLHLVEELFRAASLPDFEVPPSPPASEAGAKRSHLPPPRGKVPPRAREINLTAARGRSSREGERTERTMQPLASLNRMQHVRPTRAPGGERCPASSESRGVKAPPMTGARLLKRSRRKSPRSPRMDGVPNRQFSDLKKTRLVVIGFVLMVGAVVVKNNLNGEPESREPESTSEATHLESESLASLPPLTKEEQAKLKEAVKGFHRAVTAEAKAPFLVDGIKMLERLASYYQTHPLEPREIAIDQAVTIVDMPHGSYYQGTGRYPDGRAITFFAQKDDGDFLLDWPIGD